MHVVRDLDQVAVVVGAGLDHPVHQRLGADHVGGEGLVDRADRRTRRRRSARRCRCRPAAPARSAGRPRSPRSGCPAAPPARRRPPATRRRSPSCTTAIIRSRAPAERFRRTSTAGVVSGSSVRIFQSSCSPMKPVTPVIRIFLPASRSRSRPSSSWTRRSGGRRPRCGAMTSRASVTTSSAGAVLMRSTAPRRPIRRARPPSASVRVKLPTYSAVPMIAPSTPTGTSSASAAMSVEGRYPTAGDDRRVRARADLAQQVEVGSRQHAVGGDVGDHVAGTAGRVQPVEGLVQVAAVAGPAAGRQPRAADVQADRDLVAVRGDDLRAPLGPLQRGGADVDPGAARWPARAPGCRRRGCRRTARPATAWRR